MRIKNDFNRKRRYKAGTGCTVILRYFVLITVFSLSVLVQQENIVRAYSDKTDIRVGLEALYHDKSIITVYDPKVKIGFCNDSSYKSEIVISSKKGFSFEPEKGTYYYDNESYSTYSAAYNAAVNCALDGRSANICLCGKKCWRLYFIEKNTLPSVSYTKASSKELIRLSFGNRVILIDGSFAGHYPQISPAESEKTLSLGSRKYRGRIEIGRYGSDKITAVNIVNIEAYLKGVVTCEMNSGWSAEALKAQAVCARSYALTKCSFSSDSVISKPYSISDTASSQVYGGAGMETEASVMAVAETDKRILVSGGNPVVTYYFSTSGGATDFSSDVWGGNSYNYVGVFDEYETEPEREPWCVKYTYTEIEKLLNSNGYSVSGIREIYPEVISDSGRVSSLRIKSDSKSFTISGKILASVFGLYSTKFRIITAISDDGSINLVTAEDTSGNIVSESSGLFTISDEGKVSHITEDTAQMIVISDDNMTNFPLQLPSDDEIWFLGMGWGHGIGMSQSGANGLAKKGFDFESILKYYYSNTELASY